MHFRHDFSIEANNMNPDQTAPMEQSDLDPYCLQYWLPKKFEHKQTKGADNKSRDLQANSHKYAVDLEISL